MGIKSLGVWVSSSPQCEKGEKSSVGLGTHLLVLGDCYCKNFFRKTTKDLSVTCMAARESKSFSHLVIPAKILKGGGEGEK